MPHCTKCGAEVPGNAPFCQKCGQPQPSPVPGPMSPPWQPATTGLSENTAAALSYALGWLTGIIFFLIDKRPYVRFHAAQSIVTFGGLHIVRAVVGLMFGLGLAFGRGYGYGHVGSFGVGLALISLLGLLSLILWIVCMVKAAQGQRFMVPIAGDIAQNLAGTRF